MMDAIVWKRTFAVLILPPIGPFLLTAVGLALLAWKPRLARILSLIGFLTLFAICLPVVATALVRVLDDGPGFDVDRPSGTEAIVIIGGGLELIAGARSVRRLGCPQDTVAGPGLGRGHV